MELQEILKVGGTSLIILLLTLIKIPKIEINLWGLIGRAINKEQTVIIGEMQKSVNSVSKKLDEHIADEEEYRAEQSREYILQANDEIMRHIHHSKEWFDELLRRIDVYEDYCDAHPSYANNKAILAIQNVKNVYQMRLEQNDFL